MSPGQPDPSYATSGRANFAASFTTYYSDLVVAPDGSVYLTGSAVTKLDPRGAVVTTYGDAGTVALASSSPVLDESGNLYVISGAGIAKLDAAGRSDLSFGVNGHATLGSFGGDIDTFIVLARAPDGSLYLAGTKRPADGTDAMAIAKFDAGGRRVASFGEGGVLVIAVGARSEALVIDGQGDLFIGGHSFSLSSNPTFVVVKLHADGSRATEFGVMGFVFGPPCANTGVNALAIDPTGNVLVAGSCAPVGPDHWATVFRLSASGVVDTSFRDAGRRPGLFGSPSEFEAVTNVSLRPNGEIFVVGNIREASRNCSDFAIAKLDANGNAVPAFGSSGVVRLHQGNDFGRGLGFDGSGRLYAGVVSRDACPVIRPTANSFGVYRLGS